MKKQGSSTNNEPTLKDLLSRKIIRNDMPFEFMNKMTDAELEQFDKNIQKRATEETYDFNIMYLRTVHDHDIIYNIFKKSLNDNSSRKSKSKRQSHKTK